MSIERSTLPLAIARHLDAVPAFVPAEPRGVVLCVPALGISASYYEPVALGLAERGLAVLTPDQRGHGASASRPSRAVDYGYGDLVKDAIAVAEVARRELGGPLYALGHSLGGQVASLAEGAAPGTFDGLVFVASGTPYARCFPWRAAAGVRVLAALMPHLTSAVGYYPGERFGFAGREARTLMLEWAHVARHGTFGVRGLDAEAILRCARAPTLAVSLAGDGFAPRAAVEHLIGKLGATDVKRVHLASGTDPRSLHHLRWARRPEAVIDAVVAWIGAAPQTRNPTSTRL